MLAVGGLYAELDEVEAQIAEIRARRSPSDEKLKYEAGEARARAVDSACASAVSEAAKHVEFKPTDQLRGLYREVAPLVHPDLSTDGEIRAHRNRLMAEANRAYAENDATALSRILHEWDSSPESVTGEGVAAELIRAIRKIHQAEQRLADIASSDIRSLSQSCSSCSRAVTDANANGRDLFGQIVDELKRRINLAQALRRAESSTHSTP